MAGTRISASVGGDEQALFATAVLGHGLTVFGTGICNVSNLSLGGESNGSAFLGRWNDNTLPKAGTAETIFAVGTGNSGSAGITRKTGFLIDSGSNTFIEGTLNVSGSTTLSGSLFIQSGSGLPSQTGSGVLTYNSTNGQVGQTTYATLISSSLSIGAFSSLVTQSGSAGVSQSVNFATTDLSYGVSIQSNSQITIANAGVYTLTFSAQIKADGGQDTIYMWLKKNGTNVGATATKLIAKNNEESVMTVNYFVDAAANDYYEIVFQNDNGYADLLFEAATGNIPSIPSIILTVAQVK